MEPIKATESATPAETPTLSPQEGAVQPALAAPSSALIDKEIDRLFRTYGDAVLASLQEDCGLQAADAEELFHEIFLVRLRRFLERGRVIKPAKERNFLTRVASFAAAEFKERRRSDRIVTGGVSKEGIDAGSPTPSSMITHQEIVGGAQSALNGLPHDFRRVVELRMAGSTFPEIALEMGIEEDAARKRYKIGISRIRTKMGMIWSSLVPKGGPEDLGKTRTEILKALDDLGSKYATALIARHARGKDLKFIAATLDIPLADAPQVLARAEELLQVRFGITGDELEALLQQLK